MTTTRPKNKEEMEKLPVGPYFRQIEHVVTAQELIAGEVKLMGKTFKLNDTRVRKLLVPVLEQNVQAVYFGVDDIMAYRDDNGIVWTLGQYTDGTYFRRLG